MPFVGTSPRTTANLSPMCGKPGADNRFESFNDRFVVQLLDDLGDEGLDQQAARSFLDALRLDQGDQAAIVAFNAQPALLTGLTADRSALDSALASITSAPVVERCVC